MNIKDKLSDIKIIKLLRFYSYTSSVRERIAEYEDGRGVVEIKTLYERLRDLTKESKFFKNYNFDQNKCVYEVEIDGERLFVGFYDWKYSIGRSVHQFFGSRIDFVNGNEDWVNSVVWSVNAHAMSWRSICLGVYFGSDIITRIFSRFTLSPTLPLMQVAWDIP